MAATSTKEFINGLQAQDLKKILARAGKSVLGRTAVLRSRVFRLLEEPPYNSDVVSQILILRSIANRADSTTGHSNTATASGSRARVRSRTAVNLSPEPLEVLDVPVSPRFPLHPDVRFKALPFYEVLGELVKPSTLAFQGRCKNLDSSFTFHLTPAQAALIRSGRAEHLEYVDYEKEKYKVQVQVRIGLLETTSAQDDYHPPGLLMWVNRTMFPIPVNSSTSATEERRQQPLNVTSLIRVDPMTANIIQVTSLPHFQKYVIAVYLVRKDNWQSLLSRLRARGVRVAYYTKGMIQQKLKDDGENEIATTYLRVSLVCPLGKMRMQSPCRAVTCDHVQCFDSSCYLQMNAKKPTWLCPVCNKPALYDNLVIDEYFVEVLTSDRLPSDCSEIQLMADGGWRPMGTPRDSFSSSSLGKRRTEVEVPSSEDECEVLEVKVDTRKPARRPRSPSIDMVDLVSSPSPSSPDSQVILPFKKRKTNSFLEDVQSAPVSPGSPAVIDIDSDSADSAGETGEASTERALVPSPMSSRTPSSPTSADVSDAEPTPARSRRRKKHPSRVPRRRVTPRQIRSDTSSSPSSSGSENSTRDSSGDESARNSHLEPPKNTVVPSKPDISVSLLKWRLDTFRADSPPPPEENAVSVLETPSSPISYAINKAKSSPTTLVISKRTRSANQKSRTDFFPESTSFDRKDEITECDVITPVVRKAESITDLPHESFVSLSAVRSEFKDEKTMTSEALYTVSEPLQLQLSAVNSGPSREADEIVKSLIEELISSAVREDEQKVCKENDEAHLSLTEAGVVADGLADLACHEEVYPVSPVPSRSTITDFDREKSPEMDSVDSSDTICHSESEQAVNLSISALDEGSRVTSEADYSDVSSTQLTSEASLHSAQYNTVSSTAVTEMLSDRITSAVVKTHSGAAVEESVVSHDTPDSCGIPSVIVPQVSDRNEGDTDGEDSGDHSSLRTGSLMTTLNKDISGSFRQLSGDGIVSGEGLESSGLRSGDLGDIAAKKAASENNPGATSRCELPLRQTQTPSTVAIFHPYSGLVSPSLVGSASRSPQAFSSRLPVAEVKDHCYNAPKPQPQHPSKKPPSPFRPSILKRPRGPVAPIKKVPELSPRSGSHVKAPRKAPPSSGTESFSLSDYGNEGAGEKPSTSEVKGSRRKTPPKVKYVTVTGNQSPHYVTSSGDQSSPKSKSESPGSDGSSSYSSGISSSSGERQDLNPVSAWKVWMGSSLEVRNEGVYRPGSGLYVSDDINLSEPDEGESPPVDNVSRADSVADLGARAIIIKRKRESSGYSLSINSRDVHQSDSDPSPLNLSQIFAGELSHTDSSNFAQSPVEPAEEAPAQPSSSHMTGVNVIISKDRGFIPSSTALPIDGTILKESSEVHATPTDPHDNYSKANVPVKQSSGSRNSELSSSFISRKPYRPAILRKPTPRVKRVE